MQKNPDNTRARWQANVKKAKNLVQIKLGGGGGKGGDDNALMPQYFFLREQDK
ncbi:hypothetical protein [Kosakonia quasisacchari]|uniref:hypothetical protein n=1 Tax=Kosakonia quasisacchari TaxID=2529380 RepID=UPI0013F1750E|nr:hypothetical protein [Kosakonia quasisacchari]